MKHETNTSGFQPGNQCAAGHGRKPGKTVETRLRETMPIAVRNLCDAAEDGDIDASVALVSRFGNSSL